MSLNKIVYAVRAAEFAGQLSSVWTVIDSSILQREIADPAHTHRLGSQVIAVRIDILPSPFFASRVALLGYFAVRNT